MHGIQAAAHGAARRRKSQRLSPAIIFCAVSFSQASASSSQINNYPPERLQVIDSFGGNFFNGT
jgi:hypothetical protein